MTGWIRTGSILYREPVPAADAGPDLPGSVAAIRDERLYSLVQGGDYSEHTLELDIPGPGFGAYTFTFG